MSANVATGALWTVHGAEFHRALAFQRYPGSFLGRPKRGSTLLSKRVIAETWSPARVSTSSPIAWKPRLVNGAIGAVAIRDGESFAVVGLTVRGGRIVEIDIVADPERLRELDLTILSD